ncbi:hypothetical protein [Nocardia sp. IFM 10818]
MTDRRMEVEQMMRDFGELHALGGVQVFREPGPTVETLWSLYSALAQAGPRQHVVIPTPSHLEGLAEPRQLLLRRFSALSAQVWYLPPEANSVASRNRVLTGLPDIGAGSSLVGQFSCRALGTAEPVARLHLHEDLTRAGLRDMVDDAEAVVVSLVVDAVQATTSAISTDTPVFNEMDAQFNQLTVRVTRSADELLIEVHETREHADESVRAAVSSRGRAGRVRAQDGGTVTWCALPLTREWRDLSVAVSRYNAIVNAESGSWM